MTIDERLEKLTERHETLTETVEIVAGMQRANEQSIDRLTTLIEKLVAVVADHQRRLDEGGR